MELDFGLVDRIAQGPQWVYWWTRVIDVTNWLLIPFAFIDKRARWALLAWVCNIVIIITLFNVYGYSRILGLSHIIVWLPLLIYLAKNRRPLNRENVAGIYLHWFVLIITISMLFDALDVVRFAYGDTQF